MSHRLTDDVIRRTNAQRKRLGRPMLSRAGFLHALTKLDPDSHVDDVLVTALVNYQISSALMTEHSSAYETPAPAGGGGEFGGAGASSSWDSAAPDSSPSVDSGSL